MSKNRLIIAAAGSGKTTFLVDEALKQTGNVLVTTYTEANEAEIRNRIVLKNKFIPSNITVQTWYSFLIQHGVKPYQGHFFERDIKGMNLVGGQSAQYIAESDINHYLDPQRKVYSDKISKFLIKCNQASTGKVIDRLNRIFPTIFVDEVQDLASYDLEFLKLLFTSKINTLLVGDPRQGIYSTSNSGKNKKFKKSAIVPFFEEESLDVEINDTQLTVNYRSLSAICDLSNKLYPAFSATKSGNNAKTQHDGVFLVRPSDVDAYLEEYAPVQLRDSRKKEIDNGYAVMNFGESKGLSYDRVMIYPTAPIIKWLKDHNSDLKPVSRSKLYVAITRARYSVAIVYDYKDAENIVGINKFAPGQKVEDTQIAA